MWFAILGPLLVRDGDTPVEVPNGRLGVLLAALLLHAGKPVPADALAEVVWDGSPPPGADITLRSHVLRLRRALGPGAGARLVTRRPGYLLQAAVDEVDVLRFRCLCRDGSAALRDGEWARANGLLGEAVDLWRGAPLEDVASERLLREVSPGLEGLRLQAEEWRADAALHLGRHAELVPELQGLATRYPLRERFHAQLMLALYRCGRQAEALTAYQHARRVLIDEVAAEPGPELRLLHKQVLSGDPALAVAGASPAAGVAVPAFPYRGLSAFGEQDAGLYFGREDAAARVLEQMSGCLGGTGLVIVSGVSGAGKSSLLRAGVLPRLRQAGLAAAPDAASWPCLVFTPGRSPVAELAAQIAPLAGSDTAAVRWQLTNDPASFALIARQAARSAGGTGAWGRRVVLAVDQCEQLFTACGSQPQRQAFFTALHAAATADSSGQPPAALVVLVVRADFEARLADFPQLAASVQDRYLVTVMTRRQLRLAITRPAAVAGCGVEEDLVQVLLEEVGARTAGPAAPEAAAGAGALPLLSHALDQAWRTRAGQLLSLADYERVGGIEGAVAASAQRAYQALTPAQQQAARQVLTRLAVPGSDGTDTALPAARADLTAGKTAAQARDVEVVLERFAAERLLTLDAGTVAISHEVLLTTWPLLRDDWLADARADRATRARLHATATEWAQDSRDPSYLYSGSRLDAAAAAAARIGTDPHPVPLSEAEKGFLHASHRAARRRARTRRQLTAVLLGLMVALTTVSVMAVRAGQAANAQRDAASEQREIASSRLLINQSQATSGLNATDSREDAIDAWALDRSPQSRLALLSAAANPQTATFTAATAGAVPVAFSPDGKSLATGGPDGARLWDIATGRQIGQTDSGHTSSVPFSSITFSSDGRTLVTGGQDGTWLWHATAGQLGPGKGPFGSAPASSVALSPDGKTLATGGPGGAWLWHVNTADYGQTGELIDTSGEQVKSVAFSPDGKTLALGGTDGARLWNIATGRQIGKPFQLTEVNSVAFSPDGKTLATGGTDGARLWNIATGRQIGKPIDASAQQVNSVAFSPDGKTLATGGMDGARLWNIATGQQASVPLDIGTSDDIDAVAFSPDGKTLATGGMDGMARLWNVAMATFRQLGAPAAGDTSQIVRIVFSPDGKALVTASENGAVQLRDAATGRQDGKSIALGWDRPSAPAPNLSTSSTPPSPSWPLTLAPDGNTLAVGGQDGARLWNLRTGQPLAKPFGHSIITTLAFSPDGGTLAAAGLDTTAQLWNVATGQYVKPFARYTDGTPLAFSPDAKTLAIESVDGITLWDTGTGRQRGDPLTGTADLACYAAALSPDGKTLACAGYDGAQLWNLAATGQQSGNPLTVTGGDLINSVAFSPDGKTLATGGPSGAQLWDVATGQQIGAPLAVPGSPQVDAVAFSPDGNTLATGGADGTTQLWNVDYLTDALARLCSQVGGSLTPTELAGCQGVGGHVLPQRLPSLADAEFPGDLGLGELSRFADHSQVHGVGPVHLLCVSVGRGHIGGDERIGQQAVEMGVPADENR